MHGRVMEKISKFSSQIFETYFDTIAILMMSYANPPIDNCSCLRILTRCLEVLPNLFTISNDNR